MIAVEEAAPVPNNGISTIQTQAFIPDNGISAIQTQVPVPAPVPNKGISTIQTQSYDANGVATLGFGCQDVRLQAPPPPAQQQQGQNNNNNNNRNNKRGGGRGGGGGGGGGEGGDEGEPGEKKNNKRGPKNKNQNQNQNMNYFGYPPNVVGGFAGPNGFAGDIAAMQFGMNDQQYQQPAPAKKTSPRTASISEKIKSGLKKYEEMFDSRELTEAFKLLEESVKTDEVCCDSATLQQMLISLTRAGKLATANKVVDMAGAHKVVLDVNGIVNIAMAVSQRSPSHKALEYLRRLIYECLPKDFGDEQVAFFDRHASFIFSELMAEADGCFGRIENRDSGTLVMLGHTEVNMQMDWEKSNATSLTLFNTGTKPEEGAPNQAVKKVYVPSVFKEGFQRTDTCLMSYDIMNMPDEIVNKLDKDYDKIQDGAEVEVIASATSPTTSAPLLVKVTSPPRMPFVEGMSYRLDRLASRDQTRRMLEALRVILKDPREDGDGPNSLQPAKQLRELLLVPIDTTLTKVDKVALSTEAMDYEATRRQEKFDLFVAEARDHLRAKLNQSQYEALVTACSRRITLIQGPPGTGKTTTAVQIVSALVEYELVDKPMLVTADSNTAVDNLVKGIGKRGLQVVRVGRPDSIREDVKMYALDGRWKELKKAEVVCATCIGASGTTLDKARFGTVLIDECTQAAESAALVPLARGCQQAILIGDQCQLPPTVLSDVAESQNLGESLFARLVTQGVRPVLLDTQYRMHPLIAEFASAAFYNGLLQNGISHIYRKPPESFPWPQRQMPVAFINLDRAEERREGSSYVNQVEAEKTLWALNEVCKNDSLQPEDVGLVTPYKGQVNLIKKLIRERPSMAKFRTGLEIESVDGFQGQEKEVIIFCSVRNNREGKVGFLSDWRRLNVMLTRAKRGCIVIGSKHTLNCDPLWQEWLKWATARGAICGETAKGTWLPKYLVDDRDGMWKVKDTVIEDASKAVSAEKATTKEAPEPKEQEPEVDCWEDLSDACSPTHTPKAEGDSEEAKTFPAQAEEEDEDQPDATTTPGT